MEPAEPAEPAEAIGYAQALRELQEILSELEGGAVDVDRLASRVQRAVELIATCRDRIGAARVQVEQIVAELDSDD
jgi:exodeoxyribonuclease VII small subunit